MNRPEHLEEAAKKLAEFMDYPWDHMPEQGRETMRSNVCAIEAIVAQDKDKRISDLEAEVTGLKGVNAILLVKVDSTHDLLKQVEQSQDDEYVTKSHHLAELKRVQEVVSQWVEKSATDMNARTLLEAKVADLEASALQSHAQVRDIISRLNDTSEMAAKHLGDVHWRAIYDAITFLQSQAPSQSSDVGLSSLCNAIDAAMAKEPK